MTYIPALTDGAKTLAQGAPSDIYGGRSINIVKGYDLDHTKMRGYGRRVGREMAHRPGAHSNKTSRTAVMRSNPWWVGTQNTHDPLKKIRRSWEETGPVGTRHNYTTPAPAGLNRNSRMTMDQTPAMAVFRTAIASTGGMMTLGGTFTNPGGSYSGLISNHYTPLAPAPLPVQGVGPGMVPVGCLPGTPGCYAGPGGGIAPGARMPWGMTQNQGQMQSMMSTPPSSASPLATSSNATYQPVGLPINHPGQTHVVAEHGGESYVETPDYPSYQSPFGYGGGERISAPEVQPSGSDVALVSTDEGGRFGSLTGKKGLAIGAGLIIGGLLLFGRKKRSA